SSIVIPAMGTSGVITVNVNGDTKFEPNETFTVTLTGATNATLGSPVVATATIKNDDTQPVISIVPSVTSAEGKAGNTPFSFAVSLSNARSSVVSASYLATDGTATQADNDYTPASGTVTIPANSLSGSVTVNVVGDTKLEANETFTVMLSSPSGGTLGT